MYVDIQANPQDESFQICTLMGPGDGQLLFAINPAVPGNYCYLDQWTGGPIWVDTGFAYNEMPHEWDHVNIQWHDDNTQTITVNDASITGTFTRYAVALGGPNKVQVWRAGGVYVLDNMGYNAVWQPSTCDDIPDEDKNIADFNKDCRVDINDLKILVDDWLTSAL